MAARGEAMSEHADLGRIVGERLIDLVGEQDCRQRDIGRGHRLRDHHEIGLDAIGLASEHVAGAAEAGDHLVGDDQHVVLRQTAWIFSQ